MAVNDKEILTYFLECARTDIMEYILSLCATGTIYDDLMEWMTSLSPTLLKKYLFYLIEYDFYLIQWTKSSVHDKRQRFRVIVHHYRRQNYLNASHSHAQKNLGVFLHHLID